MQCSLCLRQTKLGCSLCNQLFCSEQCFNIGTKHASICSGKGEAYSFLKWVRGTNSWIFLSLYKDSTDGRFHLLTKGEQYAKGIMPMISSIDAGGKLYGGVNFSWTSVYLADRISQAAAYAFKEDKGKYDISAVYKKLQEEIPNEYEDVITYCHYLLKIAQYTGSTESTAEFRRQLSENPYIPMTFKTWFGYLGAITKILDIIKGAKRAPVLEQQKMQEFFNSLVGPEGLYLGRSTFVDPVEGSYSEERWVKETRKQIFFKAGLPGATYNVLCMFFFRPALLRKNAKKLRKTVQLMLRDVNIGKTLWEICIEGKKFQALTDIDKEILDSRINFLLGSTVVDAKMYDERTQEYVVPSCVLGQGGADVMIFRDVESKKKITKLLRRIGIDPKQFRMIVDTCIVPGGIVFSEAF